MTARSTWPWYAHEVAPGLRCLGIGSCASSSVPGSSASWIALSRHDTLCKERATSFPRLWHLERGSSLHGRRRISPMGPFSPQTEHERRASVALNARWARTASALGCGHDAVWAQPETTCPRVARSRPTSCEASCDLSRECERPGCGSPPQRPAPVEYGRAQPREEFEANRLSSVPV